MKIRFVCPTCKTNAEVELLNGKCVCSNCRTSFYVDPATKTITPIGNYIEDPSSRHEPGKQKTFTNDDIATAKHCPNCGALIESFSAVCKYCGAEIKHTQAPMSVRVFSQKLQDIENNRKNDRQIRGAAVIFGSMLVNETDKKKIEVIKSFPVPNNREDIIEFMILASSNLDERPFSGLVNEGISEADLGSARAVADAWLSKMEQVYQKAMIILSSPEDIATVKQLYEAKKEGINRSQRKGNNRKIGVLVFSGLGLVIVMALLLFLN